jgi:hypothetical protein
MITYLADWVEGHTVFSVHFQAPNRRRAENIARLKGWTLVGEYVDEEECPDDIVAQIEKLVKNPTMH